MGVFVKIVLNVLVGYEYVFVRMYEWVMVVVVEFNYEINVLVCNLWVGCI